MPVDNAGRRIGRVPLAPGRGPARLSHTAYGLRCRFGEGEGRLRAAKQRIGT